MLIDGAFSQGVLERLFVRLLARGAMSSREPYGSTTSTTRILMISLRELNNVKYLRLGVRAAAPKGYARLA